MFDVWSGGNLLPAVSKQKLSPVQVIVGHIKEIIINLLIPSEKEMRIWRKHYNTFNSLVC